jgi:hypothetical protein
MRIRTEDKASPRHIEVLPNDAMSPLFLAVIEATEEAVYNSLLRATTITGRGHTVEPHLRRGHFHHAQDRLGEGGVENNRMRQEAGFKMARLLVFGVPPAPSLARINDVGSDERQEN